MSRYLTRSPRSLQMFRVTASKRMPLFPTNHPVITEINVCQLWCLTEVLGQYFSLYLRSGLLFYWLETNGRFKTSKRDVNNNPLVLRGCGV